MLPLLVCGDVPRGYLDNDVFHSTRECEDCTDPRYELPMTTALKWDAGICDKCVE